MSFVDVSPSTESWFQVRDAAPASSARSVAGSAVASVRMTDSIVAIRGWIMPTPLAMPLTVIDAVPPPAAGTSTRVVAVFVVESVVRSATAAAWSAVVGRGERSGRDPDDGVPHEVDRQPRADDARREVEHLGAASSRRLPRRPRRSRPGRHRRPVPWPRSPTRTWR